MEHIMHIALDYIFYAAEIAATKTGMVYLPQAA
jgi:hypothetical protein